MLLKLIKKIPFIIPFFATVNIIVIKTAETIESVALQRIAKILFNYKMPFYFNYWIIYVIIAIIISIFLAFIRKYNILEAIFAISINLILCVTMLIFIMSRM